MHPQILDLNNNLIAVLQNSFKIGYTKVKNNLWTCQFTMPLNDPKNAHVKPKYFVELYDHDKRIGRFIVNPKRTIKNESTNEITYTCEHVLSTLHSDVLFRYHQYTNFTTRDVLTYLMMNQETTYWQLGTVEFTRYFHYSFENDDSLLNAIFSIPRPFDQPYLWTWDDSKLPFTLNLVHPSNEVKDVIAAGKNLKGIEIEEDATNLVTRIYPLGSGEGVNQLSIEGVNGGVPYLQAEQSIIDEYGIHKRIWVDNRFEIAESLKASAQAILDKFKRPLKSVAIDCTDYRLISKYKLDGYEVGDVMLIHDQDTGTHEEQRLEKLEKSDIYGAPDDVQLELGHVFEDITTTMSELEKKQLVNDTYSQGATNIDSRDFQDNCDSTHPAIIRFPIPDDVVNINEMSLTFETSNFRAFERATQGGGAIVKSTEGGGGTTATSSSGGGTSTTSGSGGGTSTTSGSGGGTTQTTQAENWTAGIGGHNHSIPNGTRLLVEGGGSEVWEESGQHTHTISVPNHTHSITIAAHSHSVSIPNHTHDLSLPDHSHEITLPDHTHELEYGIYEYPSMPSRVTITVDGNTVPVTATSGDRIDLIPYLAKDSAGKIQRGRYAEIEIKPNNLARINATVTSRLFIQSRVGGKY